MPTCTVTSFQTAAACYKNFNQHDRLAFLVYLNSIELTASGGTAYTLGVDGTLLAAATIYEKLNEDQLGGVANVGTATLVINANNATAAGASVSTNIQTLAEAIKCLNNFSERTLRQMLLLLQCQLGGHDLS